MTERRKPGRRNKSERTNSESIFEIVSIKCYHNNGYFLSYTLSYITEVDDKTTDTHHITSEQQRTMMKTNKTINKIEKMR